MKILEKTGDAWEGMLTMIRLARRQGHRTVPHEHSGDAVLNCSICIVWLSKHTEIQRENCPRDERNIRKKKNPTETHEKTAHEKESINESEK